MVARQHPATRIVLKEADVDEAMVPVVRWLNGHESVYTLYCCQGDDGTGARPYVLFLCWDAQELLGILAALHGDAEVEVEYYQACGLPAVRYTARWDNEVALRDWRRDVLGDK